ncbi:hypothetical protein BDR26DRAFT_824416 [Obelidium mucronatum]|nr:hypothetical protein BDR26DRAFT_824416 [Obelidium mucronatum]
MLFKRSLSSLPKYSYAVGFAKHGSPAAVVSLARVSLAEPTSNQVTIKFLASPINPADINQIQGTYPILPQFQSTVVDNETPFAIGGNEGVAEIVKVGSELESLDKDWLRVGSRVVMRNAGFGTWRQFANAQVSFLIPLNHPGVKLHDAATLMVNPCTAYRMLTDFKKLNPGDVIIQNGANSAVGQAVIQIAKARNIKTINMIRGTLGPDNSLPRSDLQELKSKLVSMGASLVVTEEEMRNRETNSKILELGNGSGPSLGFNCVGGKSATNMARVMAPAATMVTYGGMSKEPVAIPTGLLIFKDLVFRGFWMTRWNERCVSQGLDHEREAMLEELAQLVSSGKLRLPAVETVSIKGEQDLAIVKDAFSRSMGGRSSVKQLLQFL